MLLTNYYSLNLAAIYIFQSIYQSSVTSQWNAYNILNIKEYYNSYIANFFNLYIIKSASYKAYVCLSLMCTNALILYLFMCNTNWQPNLLPVDLIVKDILEMSGNRKQYPWNDKYIQPLISALISWLILFRSNSKLHTFRMFFDFTSHIDWSVVHKQFTRLTWFLTTQQKDRCVFALI